VTQQKYFKKTDSRRSELLVAASSRQTVLKPGNQTVICEGCRNIIIVIVG